MVKTLTCLNGAAASHFGFGTMQFGGRADERACHEMFDAARCAGITHFDTANVYTEGHSERILGQLCAADRDSLLIATKANAAGGSTRKNILASFDLSRQRLQLDQVDLFYLHRFDPNTPLEETFDVLAELKAKRQIRYIGVSNFAAWQVMKAVSVANDRDLTIDAVQPMYSLVKRQVEVEILPMAQDQNILVAAYSPLGGGLLTGKYANGGTGRLTQDSAYAARYANEWMHKTAQDLLSVSQELSVSPATLAVAWVAAHETQPLPLLSARSLEHLQPSLDAIDFALSDTLYQRLSALSPTPAPATDRSETPA